MHEIPDILKLSPNRVWRTYPGGRVLDTIQGISNPGDSSFPEDWMGSTTRAVNLGREHLADEGLSRVLIGGEERYLRDLIQECPGSVVGPSHYEKYGPSTQFLLKFLDSAIRLHIQCHPTISFAKKHLGSSSGKTEAYVILAIREEVREPYIYLGFQTPPDRETFRADIEAQNIAGLQSCFERIPIAPGDVFIVPGGLPHAIGEGVFMVEIMEPTDFAVRIEFEKGGYVLPEESRFMGRGIDFALSMFNYDRLSAQEIKSRYFLKPRPVAGSGGGREYSLIDRDNTSCFGVRSLEFRGEIVKKENSFYIGIVTEGSGMARCEDGEYSLKTWDKFLVPFASGDITYRSDEGMKIVSVFPPT